MTKLSIVIPCYNEATTLEAVVDELLALRSEKLALEIVIVDDCSTDASGDVATCLAERYPEIKLCRHERNTGKGGALRTGFMVATGDYVGIQDADMEYNPRDYLAMLRPIMENRADIVLGSRYLRADDRIVLKWWHSAMNRLLTWWSNVFTDLDLTDMETCYKLFRREIIQKIAPRLKENRFGFEPEIVAEIARCMRFERWRVGEVAIGYRPRTFSEGKKIRWTDGLRALYCVFHYNAPSLPFPMQLFIYFFIGLMAAVVDLGVFVVFLGACGWGLLPSVAGAFLVAATVNYLLCVTFLFRHRSRWNSFGEFLAYTAILVLMGALDYGVTLGLVSLSLAAFWAKAWSNAVGFLGNYFLRKFFVFGDRVH